MGTTVVAADYGIKPNSEDCLLQVRNVLEKCKSMNDPLLTFAPGTYHFHSKFAYEQHYFLSNNDGGLKRIAFFLKEFKSLMIDGQGATFVFHGMMIPFLSDFSSNITIKNITIDWNEYLFCEGDVVESGDGFIDMDIPGRFTYEIENGLMYVKGEGWREPVSGLLEMDPSTSAPAYKSGDHCGAPWHSRFECGEIGNRKVRMKNAFTHIPKIGNRIVLAHHSRYCPGICMLNSENINLHNITIHQAPAMGILATRTTNIDIRNVSITPRKGSGLLYSTCADATHFVNCRGKLIIDNCLFENELDDAINIHGIYTRVEKVLSDSSLLVREVHGQQRGADIYGRGDTVAFVQAQTLNVRAQPVISDVERINADYLALYFQSTIMGSVSIGDVVENVSWYPDATITNCIARNNRARGFLLHGKGKILVEGNTFSPGGAGISFGGDANFWFESGPVDNVIIRNNKFIDCNYGPWNRAAIEIAPAVENIGDQTPVYHKNISIDGNLFQTFDTPLLYAHSVGNVSFVNNTIKKTSTYSPYLNQKSVVELSCCSNVSIRENCFNDAHLSISVNADETSKKSLVIN